LSCVEKASGHLLDQKRLAAPAETGHNFDWPRAHGLEDALLQMAADAASLLNKALPLEENGGYYFSIHNHHPVEVFISM